MQIAEDVLEAREEGGVGLDLDLILLDLLFTDFALFVDVSLLPPKRGV